MKKTIGFLMLLTSITGISFAQTNSTKADETFEIAPNYPTRRFTVDLGKGNKMQIELVNLEDLSRFANMDSVLRVFLNDMDPLKDSLGEQSLSRRIDYLIDTMGLKKIRIQQFKSKGSTFVVSGNDLASLKLEQDTINFVGAVSYVSKTTSKRVYKQTRYYRVIFFLNDLSDLSLYQDGSLNNKIAALQNNMHTTWITTREKGKAIFKVEPLITAKRPKGFVGGGDFLNLRVSVDIQNYKHYFVPSFSLGVGVIFSTSHFKRDIVLSWDPHFFFGKNGQDKLRSFRNDFLTLTWGQGIVRDNDPRKESHLLFIMSLGYLVKREGDYFDKNSFRMGAGRLSLFQGKSKIEPVIYFNNFFKGVTPGLRLIQSF